MHDKSFQLLLKRVKSAGTELNLSSPDSRLVMNHMVVRGYDLSLLTLAESQQFKEVISQVAINIRKLNWSRNLLSNLGDLHVKRTTSGGARCSDEDTSQIIRNVFAGIELCRNLVELSLSECDLESFCLADGELQKIVGFTLRQFPNLKKLDISNNSQQCHRNQFTDDLYAAIGDSNIEELNLSGCTLGKYRMSHGYFDLKSGEIKALISGIFNPIKRMKRLKKLDLSNNELSKIESTEWDFIATTLAEINSLQHIDITRNGFNTYLTKDTVPSSIVMFIQKLTMKGLVHDLSCIKDLHLFRRYVDERNIMEALNVVSMIPANHPDFNGVRFEAFELKYNVAKETMTGKEAFKVALPYVLISGRLIPVNPQELKVFDAYLLSYFGEVLPPDQLLSVSGRMAYLRRVNAEPENFQVIIENIDNLNDLIISLQSKFSAVQDNKSNFLVYISENNKWYYVGLNSDSIPTIGYVSDIKSLDKLSELLKGKSYADVSADNLLITVIKQVLLFSEDLFHHLEELSDSKNNEQLLSTQQRGDVELVKPSKESCLVDVSSAFFAEQKDLSPKVWKKHPISTTTQFVMFKPEKRDVAAALKGKLSESDLHAYVTKTPKMGTICVMVNLAK